MGWEKGELAMNNQKLIKKWESKEGVPSYEISAFPVNPSLNEMYIAGYGVARKEILDDLKQLDEPKKSWYRSLLRNGLSMPKER